VINCRIRRRRGAEGCPHGEFARPRDRSGEEQVRDVGAGNQQHDRDGAEQQQQRPSRVAGQLARQRSHPRVEPAFSLRKLALHPPREGVELGLRAIGAARRRQAADDASSLGSPRTRGPRDSANVHQSAVCSAARSCGMPTDCGNVKAAGMTPTMV
jgi:hypothetical protein